MSFSELAGVVTILGAFLTLYGIVNNRTIKEGFRNTQEILKEQQEILKGHSEILSRMERGQEEARKEMAGAFRKMDETIKYLGDLIRSDGERTREAIRGIRG